MGSGESPWNGSKATYQMEPNNSSLFEFDFASSGYHLWRSPGLHSGSTSLLFTLTTCVMLQSSSISLYLRMTLICSVRAIICKHTTNININLSILFDCLCANKISLNLKKTNYILFHHRTNPFLMCQIFIFKWYYY